MQEAKQEKRLLEILSVLDDSKDQLSTVEKKDFKENVMQ